MTKTKKIAITLFSAVVAVCMAFSMLLGFGVLGNKVSAESVQITMVDGAALRLSEQPALGFYATLDSNNEAFSYGMLIVDSEEVKNNNITSNYHSNFASNEIEFDDVECIPYLDGGVYKIRAASKDLTESLFYTRYMGIAYAEDEQGNYTYASVNVSANARSVIDVAVANYGQLSSEDYTAESLANLADFYENVKNAAGNGTLLFDNVETREESIVIKTGASYEITPEVYGEGSLSDVSYVSDNNNVFTVANDGVITAENPGEAYLRVRIGKEEKKVLITVQDEVLESLVSDTFKAIRISGAKYEIQGDNIKSNVAESAMVRLSGGFDFTNEQNGYLVSSNVYNGISEVEFDLYAPTIAGWWGIGFIDFTQTGASWSGYRSPVTISANTYSPNGATITKVNDVSFNITREFVNFRLVISSSSEASLYINGVHACDISGYTGSYKNFQTAKIVLNSSSASNVAYIDNVKVTHTGEYVQEGNEAPGNVNGLVLYTHTNGVSETDVEDFSRGYSHFTISGKSAGLTIENGIYVGEREALAGNKFYSFGAGAIPSGNDYSTTYMQALSTYNMTEFSFDVKISDTSDNYNGFWLTLGSGISNRLIEMGSKGFYLFPSFYASFEVMDGVQTVTTNNNTTTYILNDNTEWTTYKFVKASAYNVDIYAGARGGELSKLVTVTLDANKLQYFDMALAQNASAKIMFTRQKHTSATFSVGLDNLSITTASGTVTETFDNMTYENNVQTFDLVKVVGVKYEFSAQYTQGTDAALFDNFGDLNRVNVKKEYSHVGSADSLVLELNTSITIKDGKQIGILLGNDNTNKVASLILISNGLAKIVSVGQYKITEQAAVSVDVSDLRIKVNANGSASIYNGSEFVTLGTLASLDGKISFVDYNGVGSAVINNLTINGSKDYIVTEDQNYADKQIVISAYSVLPDGDKNIVNWLDWTNEELYAYLEKLRDAGFTTGMGLTEGNFPSGNNVEKAQILDRYILGVLDICEELGIDYYVKDWILLNLLTKSTADVSTTIQELFTNIEYIHHEAYRGNVGTDEPGIIYMDRLKEMYDAYKQAVPHGDFNMNFLPDYAKSWQYEDNNQANENSTATYTHLDYLNTYMDKVGKDAGYISIDFYPFNSPTGIRAGYLNCLARVANLCKANNLQNRQYIQIDSADTSWVCKNQAEVTLQVYTHLAFGATHLTYYVYEANCFDENQNANAVYGYVKNANSYVKALEKVLLDYTWKGVYYQQASASSYRSGYTAPEGQLALSKTGLSAVTKNRDTLVGVFEKADGSKAYMVVNVSNPNHDRNMTNSVSVTFDSTVTKAIVYYNGVKEIITVSSNKVTKTLNAGDGMFIIPLA